MEERSYIRFFSNLSARYLIENGTRTWEDCTIMNVSYKGIGIRFHTSEKINIGLTIHLKIAVPRELEPISVMGILKWIGKEENHFIGGIELTDVLEEDTLRRLEKSD